MRITADRLSVWAGNEGESQRHSPFNHSMLKPRLLYPWVYIRVITISHEIVLQAWA